MIYIVLTITTTLLAYCADNSKGFFRVCFVFLWVALFCFVAGARDASVGVDVLVYGQNTYLTATSMALPSFLGSFYGIKDGIGCALYFWAAAQLADNFGIFLGALQLACLLPYCYGTYKSSPNNTAVFVFFYSLYLFPLSLCLMKQMIACSIVFAVFRYCRERRFPPFFIGILFASSFHFTAVIALILYPLVGESLNEASQQKSLFGKSGHLLVVAISLLILALAFLFHEQLLRLLITIKDSYRDQLDNAGDVDLFMAPFVLLIAVVYIAMLRNRKHWTSAEIRMNNTEYAFERSLVLIIIIAVVISETAVISSQLTRLSHYFFVVIPIYCSQINKNRGDSCEALLIMVAVFIFFVVTVLIQGIGGVVPYTSAYLGI